MITIIGRRLIIPDCDRVLGVVGDKNTPIRIKLSASTLETYLPGATGFGNVSIILKFKHENNTVNVPPILCVHSEDGIYVGDLSIFLSVDPGLVTAQAMIVLPGNAADDKALNDAKSIWQSDEEYFYIADDVALKDFSSGSDTYFAFQNLLGAVSQNAVKAEGAKDVAEKASKSASDYANNAETAKSEAVKAAEDAKTAKDYAEAARDEAETAAKSAEAARDEAETAAKSAEALTKGLFTEEPFGWTKFEYTLPSDPGASCHVADNEIFIGGTSQPIIIHCAGKTLGFTFSISGYGDAVIKINGKTSVYSDPYNDGREFVTNAVIPLTYMESDIEISGGMKTFRFTNMVERVFAVGGSGEKVDLTDYVKNTDYASADVGGVIRIRNDTYGLQIGANDGIAFIKKATNAEIDARTQGYKPIVPATLEYAVKSVGNGYYATVEQVGDIDVALDSIITIMESFAPTGFLPGEEEEEVLS